MKGCLAFGGAEKRVPFKGAFQHVSLCLVSRCDKMVAASKRFTIHRVPKVLTLCLKRFEEFTGRKISKVCTPVERNFLFPEQEISQSSTLFHKLFRLSFSCSLLGRGEERSRGKTSMYSAPTELLWPGTVSCHPNHYMLKAISCSISG